MDDEIKELTMRLMLVNDKLKVYYKDDAHSKQFRYDGKNPYELVNKMLTFINRKMLEADEQFDEEHE